MFVVEYGIMMFSGQRIIHQARLGIRAATTSTQKAQKRLIMVMVLQALYPLVLYFVPCMYVTAMISMGVNFQNASYVAGISVQLLSPLNSISVLTLIPAYRRVLTRTAPTNSATLFISVTR
uniref:G protein-coupled receptor n=3 Tax=Bursaphelenchus xylophilus TaxID=6326 RepID=A0A1I7SC74_BURXY